MDVDITTYTPYTICITIILKDINTVMKNRDYSPPLVIDENTVCCNTQF